MLMGMSLYYTAKREKQFNERENNEVQSIVDSYCSTFPVKIRHEDFCLYSEPFDEKDVVMDGATAIPMDMEVFLTIVMHWLDCLTTLRRYLPECGWDVRLDDVELIWEEETGWRLPTDEEME